ncbi:hypothetical protein [Bradyrhizobium sp. CB2312]|uniref:hypothetical protein n=1 Tax=Bradyrhizobium sp. CB2312 TaxID=3039155 RepID=UPI0024B09A94|nr:hypothetical protein [Bradyrhizobium sp. CB2312]WFU71316.1 hypothetical protein QA642_39945 [Bradyrhizobium sp. CB2312]
MSLKAVPFMLFLAVAFGAPASSQAAKGSVRRAAASAGSNVTADFGAIQRQANVVLLFLQAYASRPASFVRNRVQNQ